MSFGLCVIVNRGVVSRYAATYVLDYAPVASLRRCVKYTPRTRKKVDYAPVAS
jgi:hypothetical protein